MTGKNNLSSETNQQDIDASSESGVAQATLISDPKARLTQFEQNLQAQTSKDGFLKAKRDVDKALRENKIILNNRFVLENSIGSGGMGTVFRAQDLRKVEASDTNPHVAIKVLNGNFKEHPDAFIALQREASRSSRLSHPNIVTVYDFDRDDETIYMTMELLEGEDLYSLITRHEKTGLPKTQAMHIVHDICAALSFAHAKGIIHCDLKPANIFVTEEGAKVLDFGIARLAMQNQDNFDAGKMGALTPGYASFEMFNKEDPDPSDDVFAAATIAYELLSGEHPYGGKSAHSAVALGLKPKPIDGLSNKEWRALEKALQLKKENRTQSIDEFVKELTGKRKFSTFNLVASTFVLVAAGVLYFTLGNENQLKRKIEETLSSAEQCLQQKQYQCSINNANVILKIEPQHQAANAFLTAARLKLTEQQINSWLNKAETCFGQNDFSCSLEQIDQILAIKADHKDATDLRKQVIATWEQQEQSYQELVTKAQDCYATKQFRCAIKSAEQALTIKPDDKQALAIQQDASFSEKQTQEALVKAKNIVNEGQACFKKYDYSCAIAKAEAALAFVSEYPPAIKLKRDAQQAIEQAKKGITIE